MAPFPSPTRAWHTDTYPSINPSNPELSLAGKTVVITGGGAGIGGAIARSFARAGVSHIALIGRRKHLLEENKAEILSISKNTEVFLATADISNEVQVQHAFNAIKEVVGPLNILVNNAAYFSGANPVLSESVDEWFKSFEVNVKGSYLVAKAFLQVATKAPTLVNITSAIAHMPSTYFPGFSAYAASKIASTRFFDYLQSERPDLHMVSIHPGQVATEMAEKVGMTTTIDHGKSAILIHIKKSI